MNNSDTINEISSLMSSQPTQAPGACKHHGPIKTRQISKLMCVATLTEPVADSFDEHVHWLSACFTHALVHSRVRASHAHASGNLGGNFSRLRELLVRTESQPSPCLVRLMQTNSSVHTRRLRWRFCSTSWAHDRARA